MKMRSGFTLIELLVVVGIMGLLGTASVGGYRAMQRGMEERGVLQNADTFVKTAYERAQVERQPTAVYFWNEMLREASDDEPAIIVGRAVAVRRQGRITRFSGDVLYDEFADLNRTYPRSASVAEGGEGTGDAGDNTMYLYLLDYSGGSQLKLERSIVSQRVVRDDGYQETYLNGVPEDNVGSGKIYPWGFEIKDQGSAQWKVGSAYGIEFAELTLPNNYFFGGDVPTSIDNPVKDAGVIICGVGRSTGTGTENADVTGSVGVYALRPGDDGSDQKFQIGTIKDPRKQEL